MNTLPKPLSKISEHPSESRRHYSPLVITRLLPGKVFGHGSPFDVLARLETIVGRPAERIVALWRRRRQQLRGRPVVVVRPRFRPAAVLPEARKLFVRPPRQSAAVPVRMMMIVIAAAVLVSAFSVFLRPPVLLLLLVGHFRRGRVVVCAHR